MKEKFLQFCQKEGLFESHQKVLLALSGGVDSMTLLDWLYHYRHQLGIELVLAHVNHHQRMEADQEERGIQAIAEAKHLPLKVAHFSGPFSESRARQFRYDFFEKVMKEEACSALVTAHHMDDQAETILMRLIRGSRPRHLKGIPLKQPFGQGVLIRPLLHFKKKDFPEIFHYEDKSNRSLDYFRNRIRHRYLPLLEKENPQVTSALVNLGEDLSHWHQALKELTKDLNPQDVTQFQKQSPAVQIYLLEEYLASFPDLQLSRAQFEQLHRIVVTKSNTQQVLKNGYELYKDYHYFEIRKISRRMDDRMSEDLLQFGTIKTVGAYRFLFGVEPSDSYMEAIPLPNNHPVSLRPRKRGDRILINGHYRKVSRLLINQKIPLDQRNNLVVLEQDIKKILISHDEIVTAARELGKKLTEDYQGKNPILVGILKGSVPFMAELIKHIDTHIELDFMLVSSYHGGTSSSGVINIIKDIDQDIKDRDILFVEDIIDTGKTLKSLKELFEGRQPASVKIATLLDKPEGRLVEIEADYTCFTIPNEFVVGYGLDYDENYRNLPYIGVLKEEVYSK